MADERAGGQFERWMSVATNFVAPATLLSTLLFYFGYVSARAQYGYFGVDVDTIGLGTQDYVMRSPQPLLVPLLVLTLLGFAMLRLHVVISRRLVAGGARHLPVLRRVEVFATALLGLGVLVLLAYPLFRGWAFYGLATPLLMAGGALLVAYTSRLRAMLRPAVTDPAADDDPHAAGLVAEAYRTEHTLRRAAGVTLVIVAVANVFWATATIAQWSGRGLAREQARHLSDLPSVILDTQQRLFLTDPGVVETALPSSAGQTMHYRYRHLRLLIEGHDRLFLVPDQWSASDSTLVLDLDSAVRVQFQFVNDPP